MAPGVPTLGLLDMGLVHYIALETPTYSCGFGTGIHVAGSTDGSVMSFPTGPLKVSAGAVACV